MHELLHFVSSSIKFALQALLVNRLRTLLSLLGVTIGIFAIVSVFTVVDSMKHQISSSIETLGDDVLFVQKWPWTFGADYPWWDYVKRPVPTFDEAQALNKQLTLASDVGFLVTTTGTVDYQSNKLENAAIVLATHPFDKVRNINIVQGRYFAPMESRGGKNVVLIGYDAAILLFQNPNSAIGKQVKIKNQHFTVIGMLEREGTSLMSGSNLDQAFVVPFEAASSFVDLRNRFLESQILVKAREQTTLDELEQELIGVMRAIRKLKPKAENDFAVNQVTMLSEGFSSFYDIMNIAGWAIGLFSILVGGFGIANIMFVSVRERINIIGLQKAVGAKDRHILMQFLTESIVLCLVGGLCGLFLIFLLTSGVSAFTDFSMSLSISNFTFGIGLSISIGVVSGMAPALSASRMNPVDALRAN